MKRLVKTRRGRIRLTAYLLAGVAVLSGGLITAAGMAARYRTRLEYTYERGLSELCEHLENMETTLTKGLYANTPAGASTLAMQLWSEAGSAKTCLGQIPAADSRLQNTYKFLSQAGEYALSLADRLRQGEAMTSDEYDRLATLGEHAKRMADAVNDLCTEMEQSGRWRREVERSAKSGAGEEQTGSLYTGLSNMEESLNDLPTLLYDGPFSDHLLQPNSLFLQNKPEVSAEQALAMAAKVLNCPAEELEQTARQEAGAMPCLMFEGQNAVAAITRRGGYALYWYRERAVGEAALSYEACLQKAKAYADATGLGPFEESYYSVSEGVCLVNFAYRQDDVVCYPDLVKIGVAVDTGEIVSYNAQGYMMNHTRRSLPADIHAPEEAEAALSPLLKVKSSRKAVIPLNDRTVQLCYEFLCTGKEGDEVLVYINAETLEEEQLLLLLKTDGGTLTL